MTKVKRNFKDSLFRLVFHGKEELLSLYNAVNGSSYTNADDLEINTLEDVVYMGVKNDVSFLFAHYLNLYEAQSTSNPNMPLRGTIYFGDLIKGWVESNHLDMYSEKQIMIPKPKFLVFYNGLKKEPERKILRLSDSFEGGQDEEAALECTAIMLNINYGYNQKLMEKCHTLHDYSYFVENVRQGVRVGKTLEEAVDEAISKSLKEGVLKDLLKKNRAEVRNVVLTEYNEELHLKNVRECGYEEGYDNGYDSGYGSGLDQGRMQNQIELVIKKVRKGQSLERIADALETSEDQLKEIYEAVVKAAPGFDFEKIQGELKIKKQE